MSARLVWVTCASREQAEEIGKTVVLERLAACANVLGATRSFYWWNGEVQADDEVTLVLKTAIDRVDALIERVRGLHSYEVPGISVLQIEGGNPAYLAWITAETR